MIFLYKLLTIIEHSFHFLVKRNQQNVFGLLSEINIYKESLMVQSYDKYLQEEHSEIVEKNLERRKQ